MIFVLLVSIFKTISIYRIVNERDTLIVGMHEMNIIRLLHTSHVYNSRLFIYYAQLINDQIPSSFEHELNTCSVNNLEQLCTIIKNPLSSFKINTRVLKEILRSNLLQLNDFLDRINTDLILQLYQACLACNYQNIDAFVDNFHHLHVCLQKRKNI